MANVTFCSIVLNEEMFIRASLEQHYALCDRWIIVEGADRLWPDQFKTSVGLSIDNTAEIIRSFPDPDKKIEFIQVGHCQNKMELRNHYARRLQDDIVVIIDTDEFLPHAAAQALINQIAKCDTTAAFRIPIVHFRNSPHEFMTGGYWDVAHNRAYRWTPSARYTDNHNHPAIPAGAYLHTLKLYATPGKLIPVGDSWTMNMPMFLHYGALKPRDTTTFKNQYYLNRGEGETRKRTTADRAALLTGEDQPDVLIRKWAGPWPEVLPDGRMP